MNGLIKKYFIVFLLILIFSIFSFGQYPFIDFMPGYYITNTNDTIKGQIGLPSFPDSSKIILYKSDEYSKAEIIKSSETILYKRNNTVYITKEFKLNNKVDFYFVKPIIKDRLSLFTLWIHVYKIPDYKNKQFMYLSDREGFTKSFDDFPNYFRKIIILKLEHSDYLILPQQQSNYVLSKYLSEYPSLALKIINKDYSKDDIELVVKEFNKWNKGDMQISKQDSIVKAKLERKLNNYADSKLSIEIPVAFNSIRYTDLSIQDIDYLYLHSINLQNDISYGIGLKYSIFNSLKIRVGWQTDQMTMGLGYMMTDIDTIFYSVMETYRLRRNTGYLSLMNEGRFFYIGGGIELEKYRINKTNLIYDYLNPAVSLYPALPEIKFKNNTNVNFQLFIGLKTYTKFGLRVTPYIGYSHPIIKKNELSTNIKLREITAGLIFEYKILNID